MKPAKPRDLALLKVFCGAGCAWLLTLGCSGGEEVPGTGGAAAGGASTGGSPSGGASVGGGGSGVGGQGTGGVAAGGADASGGASSGGSASGGANTVDCNAGTTLTTRLPCALSETGLYQADMSTLGEGVHPYEPQFKLWSDTAEKKRWIQLPAESKIDTTNMDYWVFPAGTKLWKEFVRDGVRVETRLIEKQPSGTWYTVAYHWQEDQKEAIAVPDGIPNASGTEHDVPDADQCWTCHSQQPDKALGFSAIQLSHEPVSADPLEFTLEALIDADLLTAPPDVAPSFSWEAIDKDMLGYLHANCGTCHNPMGSANSQTGLDMWLKISDLAGAVTASSVYQNLYDVDIKWLDAHPPAEKRVKPGDAVNSAIYQRFVMKDQVWTMPPLASEIVDPAGQKLIEDFIAAHP